MLNAVCTVIFALFGFAMLVSAFTHTSEHALWVGDVTLAIVCFLVAERANR
jgi:ABC-type phosphate transport system permease subunit